MFEHLDDHEPVQLRPQLEHVMREAKRRTVRRIGATSTCLVLLFGAAVTANRYFQTEQTVRIENAASSHVNGPNNAPSGGQSNPAHPGTTQPKSHGNGSSNPGNSVSGGGGNTPATTPAGTNSDSSGNPLVNPQQGGGTTGGTVPSGGDNGGDNTPQAGGVVWTATANTTSSPSAENAFITVTVTVTNNTTTTQTIDFKECNPTCKRVKNVGTGEIAPDWDASEGTVVKTIDPGATIQYDEVIRMRTGAGFLAPGPYTLVIYGTSLQITIT